MSIENFLLQPYDIRMLIVRSETGIDDDRTVEAVQQVLGRKLTSHEIEKLSAGQGEQVITFTFKDCVGVRYINPDLEDPSAAAAHEAFHVTCSVLRFAGVKLSTASEEAYAYLIEHVFKRLREAACVAE